MIILIGGASSTGKTLMAQRLLERYHMPYLSLDHLKMGLIRSGSGCNFSATDSDETIAAELWPIAKGMIITAIENRQNLIVEGCYILPEYANDLCLSYPRDIAAAFILFSTGYIKDKFTSEILKHQHIIEHRCFDEDRTITEFIRDHERIRIQCIKSHANFFEIEHDYETEIRYVYDYFEN